MKTFMPELDRKERLQLLRDNCDQQEETTYMRDLGQDELDAKREKLSENLINISTADDVLDEHKEAYKAKTKPLKQQNSVLLEEIKNRKTQITGTLFHIADHENGIMETYDEDGEFVSSRRLRPNEKQQKLFPVAKTSVAEN